MFSAFGMQSLTIGTVPRLAQIQLIKLLSKYGIRKIVKDKILVLSLVSQVKTNQTRACKVELSREIFTVHIYIRAYELGGCKTYLWGTVQVFEVGKSYFSM